MAQRLGRQAVTALGHRPARLAWPLPTPAHPVWPRLTGVRKPTPSGQAGALHFRLPSRRFKTAAASTGRRRGLAAAPALDGWKGGGGGGVPVTSLLLMITPASPSGQPDFKACAGPHIPMATVAWLATQCEWATRQVLPNWDDGETFWDKAESFHLAFVSGRSRLVASSRLHLRLLFEQPPASVAEKNALHSARCSTSTFALIRSLRRFFLSAKFSPPIFSLTANARRSEKIGPLAELT